MGIINFLFFSSKVTLANIFKKKGLPQNSLEVIPDFFTQIINNQLLTVQDRL